MKNISKQDYIFWNNKTKKPLEDYDIIYHYTTIIELLNTDGIILHKNEEIKAVASLPTSEQKKYSQAIERTK